MGFDPERVRADFPILATQVHGKPLVFLDSAASAQKPECVIQAVSDMYRASYANVERGVYELSVRATAVVEGVREKIARFIGAADENDCEQQEAHEPELGEQRKRKTVRRLVGLDRGGVKRAHPDTGQGPILDHLERLLPDREAAVPIPVGELDRRALQAIDRLARDQADPVDRDRYRGAHDEDPGAAPKAAEAERHVDETQHGSRHAGA